MRILSGTSKRKAAVQKFRKNYGIALVLMFLSGSAAFAQTKTLASSADRNQIFRTSGYGDETSRIKIFPDPVSDYLLASVPATDVNTTITVMSLIGTTVLTDVIQAGNTAIVLDVKNIPRGIYVIVFEARNDRQVMKFVKS